MTGELHSSDSADHVTPEVIQISPPVRARTSPLVAWLACGSLTIGGFANAILGWGNAVALFSLFYFGLAAVAFWRFRVGNAAHAAARNLLMSQLDDQGNQILANAVRQLWRRPRADKSSTRFSVSRRQLHRGLESWCWVTP